jgi:hypothetical protein
LPARGARAEAIFEGIRRHHRQDRFAPVLDAILDVRDSLRGEGVGAQVRGRSLEFIQPVGLEHAIEEVRHAARVEAGSLEEREPHTVGFPLVLARVVDGCLDLQRAGGGDRGFRHLRALVAVAARSDEGECQRREGSPGTLALPGEEARLVLLEHVPDFVRHDARKLGFRLGEEDEARVHADVAADHREGVDRLVADHEEIDVLMGRVGSGEEPLAQGIDVVEDLRVFDVVLVDAHLAHDAIADRLFLLLGKRGRGDVAKIRKRLRAAGSGGDAKRQREQEGANDHRRAAGTVLL